MANRTLAFEIGTEELPAFDLHAATKKLADIAADALAGDVYINQANGDFYQVQDQ